MDLKSYHQLKDHKGDCLEPLQSYPTYETYEQMMFDFENAYPEICKVVNIGTLNSGRKILAVQIGDKLDALENEPNFLYTSTMHGDELAGFPTMLMLIDHLLCQYGSDEKITELVDNINIYINPLANPNGTYAGGNETVLESTRLNASFVDLNRNFPDPENGSNPDNNFHQEETLLFIAFAEQKNIHLSCNIHSGREFANYPWDTFEHLHADNDWWKRVCRAYADTVQKYAIGDYFTDYNNGISNGFTAALIKGGRQDYMNYYHRAREFTLELSDTKKLPSDQLPSIWSRNKNALLNYIEQALYGIRGKITDCDTGLPIKAEVSIPLHDKDNSSVFSDSLNGQYYRFINEGIYDLEIKADNYFVENVQIEVKNNVLTTVDISLCKEDVSTQELNALSQTTVSQIQDKLRINNLSLNNELYIQLSSIDGFSILQKKIQSKHIDIPHSLPQGVYLLTLGNGDAYFTHKIFIK